MPIAKYKEQFENRPPALGATPQLLAELKAHDAKLPLGGAQQRMLFQSLRDQILQQLISCDGAKSVFTMLETHKGFGDTIICMYLCPNVAV